MRIGELASAAGVGIETIRYYEREGLLPPPARAENGYRVYRPEHVERLAFIRHCRSLDMTLLEIGQLLALIDRPASECGNVNRLVDRQIRRVQTRLRSLRALERQLLALRSKCRSDDPDARCGILDELVAAAHGETAAAARLRAPSRAEDTGA